MKRGQTILELVVALGVVALVLTGLVAAVTSSLRFGSASKARSVAVKYAQEGIELTRKLRDGNTWATFIGYSGTGTKRWCLDKQGVWSESVGSCPIAVDSTFWREVTFTWNDPIMEVTSEVSWGEHTQGSIVTLTTYLSQWK